MTFSRTSRSAGRRSVGRCPGVVAASTLLVGAAAVLLAGACGVGQITQTGVQVPAVPGVNVNAGPNGTIGLRDLLVIYNGPAGYPQGGNAPLAVRIFNDGLAPVKLVRVSAGDAARSVQLAGVFTTAATEPPSPSPTASPSPGASPSPAASPTPAPSPEPTGPPAPPVQESFAIEIGSGSYEILVPGQGEYLQLTGLIRPLGPGMTVLVTFAFDDGTTVSVNVPFGVPTAAVPRASAEEHEAE